MLSVFAVVIALVGAYVGAIKLLVDSRIGGTEQSAQRADDAEGDAPSATPRFSTSDYRQSRFPEPAGTPLIGVNYTHYDFRGCSFHGTGILRSYSRPGVAQRVHTQLYQMRKAGIATIRIIVWHTTDATGQIWGAISSGGGRPHEPYRSNLIRYLREVRRFGFARLTLSLGPEDANNPRRPEYDPAKFSENWRFLRSVRSLAKRYGPARTRIDLMNEGAPSARPSAYFPAPSQVRRYLRKMYRLYVERFGNRDVTVSTIGAIDQTDTTDRLRTLVRVLKSTGQPLPRWYDVHIPYESGEAAHALRSADTVLSVEGQNQPLVIGETAYDSAGVARSIKRFLHTSSRQIEEVSPWFQRDPRCQIPPPYEPGSYGRTLRERSP